MVKKNVSEEDSALFRAMNKDVIPLKTVPRSNQARPRKVISQSKNAEFHKQSALPPLSNHIQKTINCETCLSYIQSGLSNQQKKALLKGNVKIEARLDLHGIDTQTASIRLCQFLDQQKKLQRRWILIIHGKGGRQGEPPILKNLVNVWLQQIPEVIAFQSAQPKDGGTGAVYVLLKK